MSDDRRRPQPSAPLAPKAEDEARRLEAVRFLGTMDSESEQDLAEITRVASAICQTPIARIALIDETGQWSRSGIGAPGIQTAPEEAFCDHAILGPDVLVVPDALADPRFSCHPAVTGEPHVRFYAGAPLITSEGLALGALCVMDLQPRQPTAAQIGALRTLGRAVMTLLAKRDLERRRAGALPGGIGHDLNNALSPILSVLEFLRRQHTDTRSQELIALGVASAERMSRIVRQIVGTARSADGAPPGRPITD